MISTKPMAVVAMLALAGGAVAQETADERRLRDGPNVNQRFGSSVAWAGDMHKAVGTRR